MNTAVNTKLKGDVTQAFILAELVKHCYAVLLPWGDNQRYDLVAEKDGRFYRVQCKTGRLDNGCVKFNTTSQSTVDGKLTKFGYCGQVEYFMVWCPETAKIYSIKPEDAGKTDCYLRLTSPANNQHSKIKFAVEYEFQGSL